MITMKILKTQIDRDDKIQELFATMNSFYDIVSDLQKESEKIDSLHDLLQRIARQTTECCYFIRDYAKAEDFCEHFPAFAILLLHNAFLYSTVKRIGQQFFSSTDDKIEAYCTVLNRLKEEFHSRLAVGIKIDASETKDLAMETKALVEETKLVVTHILDDIEVIGM